MLDINYMPFNAGWNGLPFCQTSITLTDFAPTIKSVGLLAINLISVCDTRILRPEFWQAEFVRLKNKGLNITC